MQVTCQRDALLTACQIVGAAVAARTTKPILSQIKAVAGGESGGESDRLTLMATDLEVGIRYELRGAVVGRAGAAILPVARLVSILRETSDSDITINVGSETTTIKLSTGRFELPGGNPEEFPEIPGFPTATVDDQGQSVAESYHEVTAGFLRTMMKRTSFAVEKRESTRFAVTGILWEVETPSAEPGSEPNRGILEGKLRLVATDTRRLALAECKATVADLGPAAKPGQTHLIPLKTIHLLERNLTDDGELVRVVLRPNEALFQTERALIHTRLVEGRFPPYKSIIPGGWGRGSVPPVTAGKGAVTRLTVGVHELLNRVRQAAIMADEETRRVDFQFTAGSVTLSARGAETGSGEVTMELLDYPGPDIHIAFDPNYLTEMLRALEGEPTATLDLIDHQRPAVFRFGDDYLYLVMPLSS